MIFKILTTVLAMFCLAYKGGIAFAQSCDIVPATITSMDEPEIGSHHVWRFVQGDYPDQEQARFALPVGDRLLVAGLAEVTEAPKKRILLGRLNIFGRHEWMRKIEVGNLQDVVGFQPHAKGAALLLSRLDNKGVHQAALAVVDVQSGDVLSQIQIGKSGIKAVAMVQEPTKSGYFVLAQEIEDHPQSATILYHVNEAGKILRQREFRSGSFNQAQSLFAGDLQRMFITGHRTDHHGRKVGWVMAADYDLKLLWEETFPRGQNTQVTSGVNFSQDHVVVSGWSEPLGGAPKAAWAAQLQAAGGAIVWERFLTGERPYQGAYVARNNAQTVSLIVNGMQHPDRPDIDRKDPIWLVYAPFVRVLTLNERGNILYSEDFSNANGVQAYSMILGRDHQRTLLGETNSSDPLMVDAAKRKGQTVSEYDYVSDNQWVLAISAPSVYEDPCKSADMY